MHKILIFILVVVLGASVALAHGGKSHRLLGTVKELHEDHLVVTTPDGHQATVRLATTTQYEKDKKKVTKSVLTAGTRVSIQLSEDDKTAIAVRIGKAIPK